MLRARFADPEKKASLEAYYEAHPMLRGMAEAETWDLQLESVRLFERDDADCLYLTQEEIEPWVPVLLERLKPEEKAANLAHTAWIPLDREDIETVDPAEMPLLTSICFASLREMMIVLSKQAQAKAGKEGEARD